MPKQHFQFKDFLIAQDKCAMKVTTDACLFGAWCATQINKWNGPKEIVLDIGTGTGLLSLMAVQQNDVLIHAVELDKEAATQAQQNIEVTPWRDSIAVLQGDIKDMDFLKSYDIIICNPPFYENDLQSPEDKKNIAHHSQELTLKALSNVVARHLHSDGCCFLLLPYRRHEEAINICAQEELYIQSQVIVHPSASHAATRVMLQLVYDKVEEPQTSSLCIYDEHKNYTPAFTKLLQPYYLQL